MITAVDPDSSKPSSGTMSAHSAAPLLALDELEVHYGVRRGRSRLTVRAVDGVSLDWHRGEILGLVGESGSGKSTLARAALGLVPVSRGAVLLEGRAVAGRADWRRLRRRVQVVFQDPYEALNPRHSVRMIVEEPLVVHGVPADERGDRVAAALRSVGLDPGRFLRRYPHQLSGGQRQRVAIAAALVLEPEALICDEPVSMLDVSIQAQILELLVRLHDERRIAILLITHDLTLAWAFCHRLAVMYLGRIVEQGQARRVVESPAHPYTRALVDVVPSLEPRPRRPIAAGEPPDPTAVPEGCRFHSRCPIGIDECTRLDPPLRATASDANHLAACPVANPPIEETR
jgi:oligopeptide/dipeptide ABC transporter ATP-binding protein